MLFPFGVSEAYGTANRHERKIKLMERSFRHFWNSILRYIAAGCSVASLVLIILKISDIRGILTLLAISVTCSTLSQLKNKAG